MPDEQLLTVDEVAKYLRLHPRTVSNKAQRGELPARKVGGHWRFLPGDVQAYDEQKRRTGEHP